MDTKALVNHGRRETVDILDLIAVLVDVFLHIL